MILTYINIKSFAGLNKVSFQFKEKLNVIFGINEAGKSSLMHAIKFTLFIPTDITSRALKTQFNYELANFFPKPSGDSIHIELGFRCGGEDYVIEKRFGEGALSILTNQTTRQEIRKAPDVQERLNHFLCMDSTMNLAVWQEVLFANQASLSKTVEKIQANNEISHSLSSLLTRIEGVSPEEFREKIESKFSDLTKNWVLVDHLGIRVNQPRKVGARGDFDHPHINGNGSIVTAYYAWKSAERAMRDREVLERNFDSVVLQIANNQSAKAESENFVKLHRGTFNALVARTQLTADLANLNRQKDDLSASLTSWMTLQQQIESYPVRLAHKDEELDGLATEISQAIVVRDAANLRADMAFLNLRKAELEAASDAHLQMIAITDQEFNHATQLHQILNNLNVQVDAQKLRVLLHAKQAISGNMQCGLNETESIKLEGGENIQFEASSQVVLDLPDLHVTIAAGDVDLAQLTKEYGEKSIQLQSILSDYQVETFEDLGVHYRLFNESKQRLTQLSDLIEDRLAGRNFAEMEAQLANVQAIQTRPYDDLVRIQAHDKIERENLVRTHHDNLAGVQAFVDRFDDVENLTQLIGLNSLAILEKRTEIDNLPAFPDRFATIEEFSTEFNRHEKVIQDLSNVYIQLNEERGNLLHAYTNEPSVADLEEVATTNEALYNKLIDDAFAYLRIKDKLKEVLDELGANNPFNELAAKVNDNFSHLTRQKYRQVEMNHAYPTGIVNSADVVLPNHLLSQGTSDILALAIRLAMADYYLGDQAGFLMLDDPMTELDDSRKGATSQLLNEVASTRQVFVLTCHQSHQELLGGHLVKFESTVKP